MSRSLVKKSGWAALFVARLIAESAGFAAVPGAAALREGGGESARRVEEALAAAAQGSALQVIEKVWPVWETGGGSPAQRRELACLLAEAWMESGDCGDLERALGVLDEAAGDEGAEAAALDLTRGRALFRAGRADEALAALERAARAGADPSTCVLGRSACLLELGRVEDARSVLEKARAALETGDARPVGAGGKAESVFALEAALAGVHIDLENWGEASRCVQRARPQNAAQKAALEVVEARLWCLEKRFDEAIPRLARVLEAKPLVAVEVRWGALLALVRATAAHAGRAEMWRAVGRALEWDWVQGRAAVLVRMGMDLPGPLDAASEGELKRLKQSASPAVAGWAVFCLGQSAWRAGKRALALEAWDGLLRTDPRHPAVARIWVHRAEAALGEAQWDAAADMFSRAGSANVDPVFGGYVFLRLGEARFGAGDFTGALSAFETAWRSGGRWAREAAFNAGLSAVRLGAARKGGVWLERLRRVEGSEPWSERLELELALALAREGASNAEDSLQALLKKKQPTSERSAALAALAEWSVQRALRLTREGDGGQAAEGREKARRYFDWLAQESGASPDVVGYLHLVLESLQPSSEAGRLRQEVERFFRENAESPLCAEVSFVLGENAYRAGRYADAEHAFLAAAEQAFGSELRECALYLAGQSAARSQGEEATGRALVHWDAVAQMGGKLRWKARYQQASLKCHMGDEREGILLYDLILKAGPEVDSGLRFASRCGRADGLLSLARRSRTRPDEAFAEYRTLAEDAKAVPFWRTQALYKAAKAREENAPEEALSGLMEVLACAGPDPGEEDFWIFRSGFDAARMMETRKQWTQAVGIYERLAQRKGARSREAASRAHQLRLEHFLWKE